MAVEGVTWACAAQNSLERGFTNLDRVASQIFAIKLKQVESAERYRAIVLAPPDHLGHGETLRVAGDGLPIERARRQSCDGRRDERKAAAEIMSVN